MHSTNDNCLKKQGCTTENIRSILVPDKNEAWLEMVDGKTKFKYLNE